MNCKQGTKMTIYKVDLIEIDLLADIGYCVTWDQVVGTPYIN